VIAPLRALVKRIRSVRRFASSVPKVPPATLEALDAAIRSADAAVDAARRVTNVRLTRAGLRNYARVAARCEEDPHAQQHT
jgi:hypothetical protein